MIMAAKLNKPITPEAMWREFAAEISQSAIGASSVSLVLDMVRRFKLAKHMDVTHDVARVGSALATADVAGVLMAYERTLDEQSVWHPVYHLVVVRRIMVGTDQTRYIEVESALPYGASSTELYSALVLPRMMSSFLVFYGASDS